METVCDLLSLHHPKAVEKLERQTILSCHLKVGFVRDCDFLLL